MPTSAIWFTADTHFGHEYILDACQRPFKSIKEHDDALIERWNKAVNKHDMVYHCGDFALANCDYICEIIDQLNGQKFLIEGNHDRLTVGIKKRFITVERIKEIKVTDEEAGIKQKITLCHYPIESWRSKSHGSWHLHGHCHGDLKAIERRLDVGVDCHNFNPISYEKVKEIITKQGDLHVL